ncbi:MAG: FAD-binding oxidoreductase [Kofleriaceae bacterium]
MTLDAELAAIVGVDHVSRVTPAVWRVAPGTASEAAELIGRAAAHRATIHPVGAVGDRTSSAMNTDPQRPAILVATKRLDQVLELDETSLLVHVQAGITGLELERVLAPRNLTIGDYPPVILMSSIGGLLAVRTPGKSSVRHGFFEDAVVGMSAVLANGHTIHTRVAPRRATGPDLVRALCGSEGTVGLITSVVLRIHLRPETRLTASYVVPTIDAAVSAVQLALREEATPAGIRIYDAAEARSHFEGIALGAADALICVATAGPTDLATCDRDLIASAVIAEGGRAADATYAEQWWRRIHAGEPTPAPAPSLQVMATPSKLRLVYHAVRSAVTSAGGAARAHISRFDSNGAVMFFTIDPGSGATRADLIAGAERAAGTAGGWLLGSRPHHLDTYLRALRTAIDPDQILNPDAFG